MKIRSPPTCVAERPHDPDLERHVAARHDQPRELDQREDHEAGEHDHQQAAEPVVELERLLPAEVAGDVDERQRVGEVPGVEPERVVQHAVGRQVAADADEALLVEQGGEAREGHEGEDRERRGIEGRLEAPEAQQRLDAVVGDRPDEAGEGGGHQHDDEQRLERDRAGAERPVGGADRQRGGRGDDEQHPEDGERGERHALHDGERVATEVRGPVEPRADDERWCGGRIGHGPTVAAGSPPRQAPRG